MADETLADTPAAEVLRDAGVAFTRHFFTYEEGGSTELCARELGIDEHAIVKTILLEADGSPFMVLMHGDMRASTKQLAEIIGAKCVLPCLPDKVERYTGYRAGAVSAFGPQQAMPVYMEETILNLRKVYMNGGRRGFLIGLDPYEAVRVLRPTLVKVGAARAA